MPTQTRPAESRGGDALEMTDPFIAAHFTRWLESKVAEEDRAKVRQQITALVAADPELLVLRSWREMRDLAECA